MVGVQMKMTTKQTGRFSGGLDSYPMMDYMSGQPNGRILPVAISLMGTLVKVQTKQNKLFEGVFKAFSPNFDIALEVAHQVESGKEDELPRRSTVKDKMIFKIEDIVKIEGLPDLESVVKGGFATDAEISRANNGSIENARDLEPWEPDVGAEDDHFASENNGPTSDGWSVEDMFSVNKERFAIKSDYDEKLYHTAELNIDPNSEIDQERARRADELAREIQRNPASKFASELENDDEERDIVVRSGSSSANNSTATTPTSATASGASNRYIPPNKRTGGDRANRGSRRGGGSGAQFQPPMRNQGSNDVRGPGRGPSREYGDGGAHPLNANFYAQRPGNRFAQQQQHHHHPIVAQTSHERSPTGPGGPEWERVKGPKRQDVRENHGAASFPLPPQIPGSAMNRPMTMIPPRPNADNSAHNGNRRNKQIEEELKKFGRDFQLSSNPPSGIPNMAQGSGVAGSPVVPTAASSSGQSSRMPPQSSPTQSQMPPHPPMTVPPPQQQQPQQQRRSPDLKNQPGSNYVMGGHQTGPPPHHHPHHHPNQNQPKAPLQISPGQAQPPSHPPPMMRQEAPPRMMTANESMYQQQQVQQPPHPSMSQPHPAPDYSNPPHVHQQPQRPNHPAMMPMQGQAGNGGGPPKIQPIPGHVPQMQPMVISQPPPLTMAPPPPAQTPQQQQPPQHQQHEQEQRSNDSTNESIGKKSKLNPDAAEFRPGQFRSASTGGAPPMVPVMQNPAIGNYPIPVQSPPQTPMMPQNPMASNAMYGNVSAGGPMPTQTLYVGSAQNPYSQQQQQQHSSGQMTLQIVQGGTPMYVHTAQPPTVMLRPRAGVMGPQPAVAAATGQPIMASPYQQGPYVLYNTTGVHPTTQAHPVMSAGGGFPPNPTYVMGANRMLTPQYVVPQASAGNEHTQQQFYAAVSPMVQGGPYQQTVSVQSAMHQSAPGPQYMQPQNNGNNNHSQTPPTSQQQQQQSQATNQSPATGPPPPPNAGNVGGAGSMNATPVIPYPPSAPTPQSPQYPTAPGGGAYPAPGQYIFTIPGPHYMAAAAGAQYQGGLPAGVHIQNTAPVGYGYTAQAHYVPAEMAAAVAAQAAVHQHLSHGAAGMHPAVLRSSSVTPFMPGGPAVSAASGQGVTSVSHQNNHS